MIAPLGPVPEIVGKLRVLKFLFFFLKLSNFCDALISVIVFFPKFFLSQNKYLVRATPSCTCAFLILLISF